MADDGTRAVFLDRDGTLIDDVGYVRNVDDVRLVAGAAEALQTLRAAGFLLVVVSNQSGIARGIISPAQAAAVDARFVAEFAALGVRFDAVRYCPHGPDDGCRCRKPEPGLILDAASELGIDLPRSFMVGDAPRDVEAGRRAGTRTIFLFGDGERPEAADEVAADWPQVAELILATGAVR